MLSKIAFRGVKTEKSENPVLDLLLQGGGVIIPPKMGLPYWFLKALGKFTFI